MLPRPVARFYLRARRAALRAGDEFSLASAARPAELADLLALAGARRTLVEVGTGTAWTAIVLALAGPARRVLSLDVEVRPERDRYLALVRPEVRERIDLVERRGEDGPPAATGPVEMLFIDSSHERAETMATFAAWRASLAPGAVVAFHDYGHPAYPGVAEAVAKLGLDGQVRGGLYVWRARPDLPLD